MREDLFPVRPMREESYYIPTAESGVQCGCTEMNAGANCEEGQRLQAAISATYRNCAGLYGRRVRQEAQARWHEACKAFQQHLIANHRD